jgi:D-beta-D-heptose 7-phosphate kinase/D-beta-D-heptose 1-phosphate adenosyltransferase
VQRPINQLRDRAVVLCGLAAVDHVIPFAKSTPIELIKIVRPNIYVKGGDYTPEILVEAPIVQELGGMIKILSFVDDHSTTKLIQKIQSLQ